MRTLVMCLVGALAFAGCGGDNKGNPNGPSDTRITGLTISPATDLLKINGSETFTLTGAMSNGASQTVSGTWASDAAAVAAIDSSGRATGRASGEATISGDSQGLRATRRLRVVPDYQGDWRGNWAITGCTADGEWARANVCQDIPNGALSAFRLTLTQTRDAVSGSVDFDELPGPIQGSIRISGELELGGTFTVSDPDVTLQVAVSDWQSVTTDNQRMTGRFTITLTANGIPGSIRVGGDLRTISKNAGALIGTDGARLRRALVRKLTRK
jgi:Bacterial Ig-like domain (group 2)